MFSGIVEELGKIKRFDKKADGGARILVSAPVLGVQCSIGDSISINGVCLTVESIEGCLPEVRPKAPDARQTNRGPRKADSALWGGAPQTGFSAALLGFDLSAETLRVTNLGRLSTGDGVNLELSLKVGERLGGHFVSGHVDEVGEIVSRRDEGDCSVFRISAGAKILRLLVDRGSVAVDGISLTVTKILPGTFELVIIPHTAKMTTLGFKTAGDQVNLEADMIGKYIAKLIREGAGNPT